MSHRVDPTIDVLRLLDSLRALAERPKTFAGLALGYDKDEFTMQIEKIKATLPREVRDAASIARETERILEVAKEDADRSQDQAKAQADRIIAEAKEEAERIASQARLQQEQMVSDSEILKLAKAQAEEVRQSAEREASQMRRGADRYAHDVLSNLESAVGRILAQVERGRAELDSAAKEAPALMREKAKAL